MPDHFSTGVTDARMSRITVKHLLNMMGGWDRDQDDSESVYLATRHYVQNLLHESFNADFGGNFTHQIEFNKANPLSHTPSLYGNNGHGWYSNYGYNLLAKIIEAVSGVDYLSFVNSNICNPLGIGWFERGDSFAVGGVDTEAIDADRAKKVGEWKYLKYGAGEISTFSDYPASVGSDYLCHGPSGSTQHDVWAGATDIRKPSSKL